MASVNVLPISALDSLPEVEQSSLAQVHARLVDWILGSGMQLSDGPHAGGVAGRLDPEGRPQYVYPEITGYFLQWLASRESRGASVPRAWARADAAQRWLARWITGTPAAHTRVYLHQAPYDWRNHARFCFDYAMVLRGLASAVEQDLLEADALLVERLCANLLDLVGADGLLHACVASRAKADLPARWSTHRGPFLAKAARGIISASRTLEVPPALLDAASLTYASALEWAVGSAHDYTHAFLYTIEGMLASARDEIPAEVMNALVAQFARLLDRTRVLGHVPESSSSVEVQRLDIVAQALRAMVLLRTHGQPMTGYRGVLELLIDMLLANVHASGGVPFDLRREPRQFNAWAALFAEQALDWASTLARDEPGAAGDAYLV
jgi:hypothetical protein